MQGRGRDNLNLREQKYGGKGPFTVNASGWGRREIGWVMIL